MIKSPKLYFYDTGLAAYLLELEDEQTIKNSRFKGALFENLIVAERQKYRFHTGIEPRSHFFRDSNGLEVDMLESAGQKIRLSEIKAPKTYRPAMVKNLEKVGALFPDAPSMELILETEIPSHVGDVQIVPWLLAGK
jgi:predicted AAA+ superfamily ATPase